MCIYVYIYIYVLVTMHEDTMLTERTRACDASRRKVIHFANRFVQTFVCSTRMHSKSFPDVQAPRPIEAA